MTRAAIALFLLAAGIAAEFLVVAAIVLVLLVKLVDFCDEHERLGPVLALIVAWALTTLFVWSILTKPAHAASLSFTVPRYQGGVGTLVALPDSSQPCYSIEAVIAYRFGQQSQTWRLYRRACLADSALWAAVRAEAAPVQVASKGVTWWRDSGTRVLLPLPVTVDTLCYYAVGRSRWPDGRVAEGLPGNVVEVKP